MAYEDIIRKILSVVEKKKACIMAELIKKVPTTPRLVTVYTQRLVDEGKLMAKRYGMRQVIYLPSVSQEKVIEKSLEGLPRAKGIYKIWASGKSICAEDLRKKWKMPAGDINREMELVKRKFNLDIKKEKVSCRKGRKGNKKTYYTLVKKIDELSDYFYGKNPYKGLVEGKSKGFIALSNPKFSSSSFNRKAWEDTKALSREFNVPVIIAGGLLPAWHDYFSKFQFSRQPKKTLEAMLKETKEEIGELPPQTHYFYGYEDLSNMRELFANRVDLLIMGVASSCKIMYSVLSLSEKTKIRAENYDKNMAKIIKEHDKDKHRAIRGEEVNLIKKKGLDTIYRRIRYLEGKKDRGDLEEKESEEIKELHVEKEENEKEIKNKLKSIGSTHKERLNNSLEKALYRFQNYLSDTREKIVDKMNRMSNIRDNLKREMSSLEEKIDSYFPLKALNSLDDVYAGALYEDNFNEKIADFLTKIKIREKDVEETLENLQGEYTMIAGRVVKRRLPEEIVNTIQKYVEKEYFRKLQDISPNLKVHPLGDDLLKLKKDEKRKINILVKSNLSGKVKKTMLDEVRRDYTEKICRESEKSLYEKIDYILLGGHHFFNEQSYQLKNTKGIESIMLGPFFDVEKERGEQKESENKKIAEQRGATSGIALIEYGDLIKRMTYSSLNDISKIRDIAKSDCKDVIGTILVGDEHVGKSHLRKKLFVAIYSLAKQLAEKRCIHLIKKHGDFIQAGRYPGAAREGFFGHANLERQISTYEYISTPADREIAKKSPFEHSIYVLIGNHPQEEVSQIIKAYIYMKSEKRYGIGGLSQKIDFEMGKANSPGPVFIRSVGDQTFVDKDLVTKRGINYGRFLMFHKTGFGRYKTDSITRLVEHLSESGLGSEKPREVSAGHSHVPGTGLAFNGVYLCSPSSFESVDKSVKNPSSYFSPFGIKVGFPLYFPTVMYRAYTPKNGPITYEQLTEELLTKQYREKIVPEIIKEAFKNKEIQNLSAEAHEYLVDEFYLPTI